MGDRHVVAGSVIFLVLAPGIVPGLILCWLTGWRMRHPAPSWAWTPLRVDPRLTILGCTGVAASLLMLARIRRTTELEQSTTAGAPSDSGSPPGRPLPYRAHATRGGRK